MRRSRPRRTVNASIAGAIDGTDSAAAGRDPDYDQERLRITSKASATHVQQRVYEKTKLQCSRKCCPAVNTPEHNIAHGRRSRYKLVG
ncbi:MAG: hypothetical protein ACLR6J_13015 [Parabacteroides merdae]